MNRIHQTNTANKDLIIQDLVKKKRELLERLLVLSIQTALDNPNQEKNLINRSELFSMLSLNDKSLETREKQTGIKAVEQEQVLYSDIQALISSIQQNNHDSINRLEKAVADYKLERQKLGKGKKISNYVNQTKTFGHFNQQRTDKQSSNRMLKGIL